MPVQRTRCDTNDDGTASTASYHSRKWACWLVVISLIIFAGFAAALLGGLLSGDPDHIYSGLIIVFIVLAIVNAVVMLVIYIRSHRALTRKSLRSKSFNQIQDTFSPSDEEIFDDHIGDEEAPHSYPQDSEYDEIQYTKHPPLDSVVHNMNSASVVGEMSALSPHSFELDSFDRRLRPAELGDGYTPGSNFGQRTPGKSPYGIRTKSRIPFDFASVASTRSKPRAREDPPEHADEMMYDVSPSRKHKKSLDPSAPKISADGILIGADDNATPKGIGRRWSLTSSSSRKKLMEPPTPVCHNTTPDDVPTNICLVEEPPLSPTSTVASIATYLSKAKSTVSAVSKVRPSESSKPKSPASSVATSKSSKTSASGMKAAKQPTNSSVPHSKAQSEIMFPTSEKTKPTAPASEVGSTVSSMFLKPFAAVFGGNSSKKKTPTKETTAAKGETDIDAGNMIPTPNAAQTPKRAPTPESIASPKSVVSHRSKATDIVADSRSPDGTGSSVSNNNRSSIELERSQSTPPRSSMKPPKPVTRSSSGSGKKRLPDEQPMETIDGSHQKRRASSSERPPMSNRPPSANNRYVPAGPPSTAGSEYAPSEFKSTAGSSVFSGAASSTYDPQAHNQALRRMQRNANALGAAPVSDSTAQYYGDEDEHSAEINHAGVYDVIAPPGPIGIIVDTSDDGPVVHSLKKSSPMLGLINTGDIILALDDQDVRKMNAATLTKLMAKKSRQLERKITLMPLDDY